MRYQQLTPAERYMLAALRRQGLNQSQIAREIGRHRSTVCRELGRNSTRADGRYRAFTAQDFALVDGLLRRQWSPEQVAGYLARTGQLSISHETIYRHVWRDKREGGVLYTHLRGARKRRRKRYGSYYYDWTPNPLHDGDGYDYVLIPCAWTYSYQTVHLTVTDQNTGATGSLSRRDWCGDAD